MMFHPGGLKGVATRHRGGCEPPLCFFYSTGVPQMSNDAFILTPAERGHLDHTQLRRRVVTEFILSEVMLPRFSGRKDKSLP